MYVKLYADDVTLSLHNPLQFVLLFQPGISDQYKVLGVFSDHHLSQGCVFCFFMDAIRSPEQNKEHQQVRFVEVVVICDNVDLLH